MEKTIYRNIKKAKENELEEIREVVLSDKNYLPSYHIYPKTGLLNDPNGLVFDGEMYHVFYQWYPYDSIHGMKHWCHLVTKDFIEFEESTTLIPEERFEAQGCYSGGAMTIGNDLLCFYTGNTRQGEKSERVSYQNLAIFDKESNSLKEKICLLTTPEGYTEHFRDPKPYVQDGEIRFICVGQRENETGSAVIFNYNHKNKKASLVGELEIEKTDEKNVFMWECPDLLKVDGRDVFIWCPQGLKPQGRKYRNIYSCTYAIGSLEDTKFDTVAYDEVDKGFDFYAPQTFYGARETILIGWIGVPFAQYPSDMHKWQGALTLPRVLSVEDNRLIQRPHKSAYERIDASREEVVLKGFSTVNCDLKSGFIKATVRAEFRIILFENQGNGLILEYKEGVFSFDRSKTIESEFMKEYGSIRDVEIIDLRNFEIFIDHSIIEIYLNNGEEVLTSRFFIENKTNNIMSDIGVTISPIKSMNLYN